MNRSFPRRRFLGLTLAGLASALPPGEPGGGACRNHRHGLWRGCLRRKYMRTVIRPFEAAHPGILVRYYAVRDSRNALAVLRSQRMTPNIDVVILDPPNARLAQSEGLLEQMNPQLVPNAADLGAMGRELGFWALPAMYDSMALVYAKSAFAQPPRSWRELWDPKHRGKIAISTNANVNGSMIALTALANRLAGSPDGAADLDPGLEYLESSAPMSRPGRLVRINTGWWRASGAAGRGLEFPQPESDGQPERLWRDGTQ